VDEQTQRYVVKTYVANKGQKLAFYEEHLFVERPEAATLAILFDEAKSKFAALYPSEKSLDCEVSVRLLPPVFNITSA
jgi:hypothetical protein